MFGTRWAKIAFHLETATCPSQPWEVVGLGVQGSRMDFCLVAGDSPLQDCPRRCRSPVLHTGLEGELVELCIGMVVDLHCERSGLVERKAFLNVDLLN